jgi:hypothetical protein
MPAARSYLFPCGAFGPCSPVKRSLARVGAERLDVVTRPLDAAQASTDVANVPKPTPGAPAVLWAKYYEQLAALYYRQAAYEEQLRVIDATLTERGSKCVGSDPGQGAGRGKQLRQDAGR